MVVLGFNIAVVCMYVMYCILLRIFFFSVCVCNQVCLSILNTWHGRPEEKWNPQTSSFLQVSWWVIMLVTYLNGSAELLLESLCHRLEFITTPPGDSSHEGSFISQVILLWWHCVGVNPTTHSIIGTFRPCQHAYTHHSSWSQNQLASAACSVQTYLFLDLIEKTISLLKSSVCIFSFSVHLL